MADQSQPITALPDGESWRLLEQSQIGRIGSARDGEPDIFPVSYVVHEGNIYFRTAAESRLRREAEGRSVAFEAAAYDGPNAWSVVVLGHLHTLDLDSDRAVLDSLPILDFAPDRPYVWMRVSADTVRGRRFVIPN